MIKIIQKLWGYERIITNNNDYCCKELVVMPNGYCSSVHYHKKKRETFWCIRNTLFLEIYKPYDNELILDKLHRLKVDDVVEVEPCIPHRFWAEKECCYFIETSTHDDPKDSYRIIPSGLLNETHN